MSVFDEARVTTLGYETHFLRAGAGDPLVLVHGGGAGADSLGNWQTCLPLFARDFEVFAPDMVGFGRSDCPDPTTFTYDGDARIDQLVAFVEALSLGPVSLVGNSMGGAASLGVAMKRPDLVSNLVLMGSAGLNRGVSPALVPVVHYDFTLEGMRRLVAALANPEFLPSDDMLQYRYALSVEPQVRAAYEAITAWVREQGGIYYEEDVIAKVKTRTLVFNGKDDLVIPMAEAYRFLELLDNSTGYFLPHCRHWAMIEYPRVFVSVVREFLHDYA